jgi:hypothetical protein
MVRKPVVLRSSVAGALFLAAATAGAQDTARADDARAVSCAYVVDVAWQGGFTADLRITDNGPDIDGWTARWTFPDAGTHVLSTWASVLTETDAGAVTASNASYDAVIRSGQVFSFGWTARGASTAVPSDISVNGVAC